MDQDDVRKAREHYDHAERRADHLLLQLISTPYTAALTAVVVALAVLGVISLLG